ncbi:hypothetical protein K438DRAFT_1836694 [Mycena galopus ATCC 62051]|nr:hypothetical protein K438DRAFT_1836694 [Mycena galopus ATCC 62051]
MSDGEPSDMEVVSKQRKATAPKESAKLFDDESDAESDDTESGVDDPASGPTDDQELGDDDDDDLDALNAAGDSEGLQRALAQERPQWSAKGSVADDEAMEVDVYYRSSSRASVSSGRMTIPSSNVSDCDDSDDSETRAGVNALKAAQQLVPVVDKKKSSKTASHSSSAVTASHSSSAAPIAARGKREIARDQERPTWNQNVTSTDKASRKSSGKLSKLPAHPVKVGDTTRPFPQPVRKRPHPVKLEPQENVLSVSSSSIDSDDDDDDVQVIEPSDIDVVVRSNGKVNLKQQRPRVEKTGQLAVDFFLGYYLFKHFFPSTEEKTNFSLDALVNAAHSHQFEDIKEKLLTDPGYVDLLSPVLHGRVSAFRLRPKAAADAIVVTNYGLQKNIEARVQFLLEGMRYIHVLVPGAIDPKTGQPGADVVQKDSAYTSEGIKTTLLNAFFRGTPSLAQKYASLFETGVDGRKQVPRSMVAIAGTAVHASISEYRTGYHISTKFDGNHLLEIYDTHLLLIDTLLKSNSTMLEDLFTFLTQGSHLAAVYARPIAVEALALLGL